MIDLRPFSAEVLALVPATDCVAPMMPRCSKRRFYRAALGDSNHSTQQAPATSAEVFLGRHDQDLAALQGGKRDRNYYGAQSVALRRNVGKSVARQRLAVCSIRYSSSIRMISK